MASSKIKVGGVYAIQWLDHYALAEGGPWIELNQKDQDSRMLCQSYGRVVGEDSLHYTVAGCDGDLDHPERGIVSNVDKILKSAIVKVRKLL